MTLLTVNEKTCNQDGICAAVGPVGLSTNGCPCAGAPVISWLDER
jgi:hypothetical protein